MACDENATLITELSSTTEQKKKVNTKIINDGYTYTHTPHKYQLTLSSTSSSSTNVIAFETAAVVVVVAVPPVVVVVVDDDVVVVTLTGDVLPLSAVGEGDDDDDDDDDKSEITCCFIQLSGESLPAPAENKTI